MSLPCPPQYTNNTVAAARDTAETAGQGNKAALWNGGYTNLDFFIISTKLSSYL